MKQPDIIEISRLQVPTHIGVPDEERVSQQTVFVTIGMVPSQGFVALHDNIAHTIDYAAVATEIKELAASRPRKLIETLAEECATDLLARYPLSSVEIRIEKHILPYAESVSVAIHRTR